MRLARESLAQEEAESQNGIDLDSAMGDADDGKTFSAMGVAKTISTVGVFHDVPVSISARRADESLVLAGCLFDRALAGNSDASARGYSSYHLVYS